MDPWKCVPCWCLWVAQGIYGVNTCNVGFRHQHMRWLLESDALLSSEFILAIEITLGYLLCHASHASHESTTVHFLQLPTKFAHFKNLLQAKRRRQKNTSWVAFRLFSDMCRFRVNLKLQGCSAEVQPVGFWSRYVRRFAKTQINAHEHDVQLFIQSSSQSHMISLQSLSTDLKKNSWCTTICLQFHHCRCKTWSLKLWATEMTRHVYTYIYIWTHFTHRCHLQFGTLRACAWHCRCWWVVRRASPVGATPPSSEMLALARKQSQSVAKNTIETNSLSYQALEQWICLKSCLWLGIRIHAEKQCLPKPNICRVDLSVNVGPPLCAWINAHSDFKQAVYKIESNQQAKGWWLWGWFQLGNFILGIHPSSNNSPGIACFLMKGGRRSDLDRRGTSSL